MLGSDHSQRLANYVSEIEFSAIAAKAQGLRTLGGGQQPIGRSVRSTLGNCSTAQLMAGFLLLPGSSSQWPLAGYVRGWHTSTVMGQIQRAAYVAPAILNSNAPETRCQRIRLFSFEGFGEEKPESMGYRSLSSRKIRHFPENINHTCALIGIVLRPEMVSGR